MYALKRNSTASSSPGWAEAISPPSLLSQLPGVARPPSGPYMWRKANTFIAIHNPSASLKAGCAWENPVGL
ncbi:hypothetical protein GCM10023323_39480 [Streptomyces thinghirensis]|uniref:Uncharacterized protein n=1 Tax=Streptomyces thinghirensis TaxID=551547 RepID=A0ABP9T4P5_9ACTN